jgi:pimeloyl-ACP methyl ester carboxylesterase
VPAFFVHGVPDTHRLWDPVISRISRSDVIAPNLPGFDAGVPDGFTATKEAYAEWLIAEIESVGEPVDLVGHDWGGILVYRVASLRPDLIRTWASGGSPLDPDYVWHDTAQMWQTPDIGEQVMVAMTPEAIAATFPAVGLSADQAREVAAHVDDRMKDCILKLYRSAVTVGAEWTGDLNAERPALIIFGADDPFVAPEFGRKLAGRVGGRFEALEGCGHWWPAQRPDDVAALLEAHWA